MNDYTKELGRATWNFLFTYAKGYPEKTNNIIRNSTAEMLYDMSLTYPCEKCQKGFVKYLKTNPPRTCCRDCFKNYIDKMYNELHK